MKTAGLLLGVGLFFMLMVVSGCASEPKGFVQDVRPGRTSYDANARVHRMVNFNGQMAWDDFDHFWMIERPSRLNWLRTSRY